MAFSIDDKQIQAPLAGAYAPSQSLVQGPGWNPFDDPVPEEGIGGGGGYGGGVTFGPAGRPLNDMERTIDAHNYPGGFKVATDQYAAKNSDQLDAWALAEMKYKYPNGPKNGGTWDQEFARQAALKNSGNRWGVPEHLQKKISLGKDSGALKLLNARKNAGPLAGVVDRDRSGLSFSSGAAASQRAASIARQNKSAIASRPKTQAAVYSNFGRFR